MVLQKQFRMGWWLIFKSEHKVKGIIRSCFKELLIRYLKPIVWSDNMFRFK